MSIERLCLKHTRAVMSIERLCLKHTKAAVTADRVCLKHTIAAMTAERLCLKCTRAANESRLHLLFVSVPPIKKPGDSLSLFLDFKIIMGNL